jgi:hypothetical protein
MVEEQKYIGKDKTLYNPELDEELFVPIKEKYPALLKDLMNDWILPELPLLFL